MAQLRIELKYSEGEPVIKEITRVSRPGRRVYSKIKELPRVYAGLGISILSTPRGVLSDASGEAVFTSGKPGVVETKALAGAHSNQLPLNNEVVDFSD